MSSLVFDLHTNIGLQEIAIRLIEPWSEKTGFKNVPSSPFEENSMKISSKTHLSHPASLLCSMFCQTKWHDLGRFGFQR